MNLMREMPSNNVTRILPIKLDGRVLPQYSGYSIKSHGQGVFEFTPNSVAGGSQNAENVLSTIQQAFQLYASKDAMYPVSVTGLKTDTSGLAPGSSRFCTMDATFAEYLTNVIRGRSVVDIIGHLNWYEMINVSQYFRFMKYNTGGEHYPHYDSDYTYEYNGAVTKYSLVVYFNDCDTGEIAFVKDEKRQKKCIDHTDWNKQATEQDIWLKIKPSFMKIVLFPHTLCHTVLPFTDKDKVRYICRGDILFNKIGERSVQY